MNLYATLRSGFADALEQSFLLLDDGRRWSFGDLDALSARYARVLDEAGVRPGDRIIVQIEKSPGAVALYVACLRIGAVYVPLNPAYTAHEAAYFIADAQPAVVVGAPGVAVPGTDPEQGPRLMTVAPDASGSLDRQAAAAVPRDAIFDCAPDDVAAMLYTSGTTGRSKGALLTHANLISNAQTLHALWGWRPGDVLLHALPIFHVHGLFVALHCAMLNASTVLYQQRFQVEYVRRALPGATVMMGVPTFYTRLLAEPDFGRHECAQMRLFISGSAPLLAATFDEFEQRTGHCILERYGMTETGMISSNPLDGARVAGSVGFTLPGIDLRIVDESGWRLPPGETGSVEVRGPNVFAGYWGMPRKTAAAFRDDGYFVTGDLGRLDGEGRLSLVGRSTDLIISGGYNVYPKEVELALNALTGVVESAVIGIPHSDFGEAVIAAVVAETGAGVDEASLKVRLAAVLAGFKQPKRIFLVPSLPRNHLGKVLKSELREQFRHALDT